MTLFSKLIIFMIKLRDKNQILKSEVDFDVILKLVGCKMSLRITQTKIDSWVPPDGVGVTSKFWYIKFSKKLISKNVMMTSFIAK